jgi:hypothetical protein
MLQSTIGHVSNDLLGARSPVPMCSNCRKPMVFKRKSKILFTDARAEAVYRCDTCNVETKRTVKFP